MKIYTLIGGVNGAGKSSLTGSLRSERNDFGIVVDPDKLTIQCGGDEYEGGKLAVERIERALMDGVNFTQETTLSGGYPKRLCKRAKEAGYYIRLYYVGLDTAEESIRRIRNRVERGGHDIPTKDVNARFSHRFEDVLKILPYCDEAKFFDNDNGFVLVAEYRNGQLLPIGTYRPTWLSQLLNRQKAITEKQLSDFSSGIFLQNFDYIVYGKRLASKSENTVEFVENTIVSHNKQELEVVASGMEAMGLSVETGYYDPDDESSVDVPKQLIGFHYVVLKKNTL